jgi:short subunit dehydrogenase-like uncharacterized protein
MRPDTEFEVIVYGASGFTGRLVAEYLVGRHGVGGALKWAMAGRNLEKLAAVRDEIGAPAATPLLTADADDEASVTALARRGKVILTTVGPYQLYGNKLVAACAAEGTDYVDLCGEPTWMREMIDAHDATARESGARIVFSCGFDSIPFDLGVLFLQEGARARFGAPVPRVKGRVRRMKGESSGGTVASYKATMAAAGGDPNVMARLRDPFALTPGFQGPRQPSGGKPEIDPDLDAWVAPFFMAPINTRNVHRTNLLLGHAYGEDFQYDEMIVAGRGERGETVAKAIAASQSTLGSQRDPQPGEGPSKQEREAGMYDLLFLGITSDGRRIRAVVTGDRDPGYGSTSKMISEAADCLIHEAAVTEGGIWTPGAAMGDKLTKRLVEHAGLTFTLEPAT